MIRRICGWCGEFLGWKEEEVIELVPKTSHGICEACAETWMGGSTETYDLKEATDEQHNGKD